MKKFLAVVLCGCGVLFAVAAQRSTNSPARSQSGDANLPLLADGPGTKVVTPTPSTVAVAVAWGFDVRPANEASYVIPATDCNKIVVSTNAGAVAWGLPQPGLAGNFGQGCPIRFLTQAGAVTITTSVAKINGQGSVSLKNASGQRAVEIDSDGHNYFAFWFSN